MPLTRYQIRNEYGLADPELYRAAERDDPEALLEGVAMAGLVGVLRQLGDLAEFAAEIFHDLHEEVMSTAARGHGLVARVQQLEADFPSIEKAFLSQTSHSSFFSAPGVDWHPNLRTEQNLITRGDLPRFVMDSYEECRGPPRLFLLDKFDVGGAGACLKRYTDPSFFKAEAGSAGVATGEVQREKKTRKVKKKGARMRNGGTPEIVPTSHAKLHQLLLEEHFENGYNDPARVVKLKKRQFDGCPFDSKTGKSYMEKFVETPSPEHKVVREVPMNLPPLKWKSDNTSEKALEVLEIGTVSPVRKSLQTNERTCSPHYAPEVIHKPSTYELKEQVIDRASEMVPEPSSDGETDEIPSTLPQGMDEKKFAIDGEGVREGSLGGYPSDDVTSEVENYMDALTTMESEMETDNEHRAKNDMRFLNLEKHGMDSDANEEQLELQAHFSDSQSVENSSASDDGNNSFKKGRSSFSYSDALSNVAENIPSDGDGADKVSSANETCIAELMDTPSNKFSTSEEILESKSDDLVVSNNTCIEEVKIPGTGEASHASAKLAEAPSHCTEFDTESSDGNDTRMNLADSTADFSSISSQNGDHTLIAVPGESYAVDKLDDGDVNAISDAPLHFSNVSEIAHEKEGSDYSGNEMLQATDIDKYCTENFDGEETSSSHSVSPSEEQQLCSALPEVEVSSANLENLAPMVDVPQARSFLEQRLSGVPDDVPQLDLDSAEAGGSCSEEKTDLNETSETVDSQETGGRSCNVDAVGREAVPLELPCNYPNYLDPVDHVNLDDITTEIGQAEDVAVTAASAANPDDGVNGIICSFSDMMCSPPRNQKGLEFTEAISPECLVESEAKQEVNQLVVASTDSDSDPHKSVSYNESNSEISDDVQDVSLAEQAQTSLPVDDVITTSVSSQLRNQVSEPKSPHEDHLLGNSEDAWPSSPSHDPERGVPSEQLLRLQVDQVDVENLQAGKEQIQSPNYEDQQLCFDVSKSSPEDLQNQAPLSNFSKQSTNQELDVAEEAIVPSDPLSEATKVDHAFPSSLPEDLPYQPSSAEFVPQSSYQEADGAKQARELKDSSLPSFGLHSVATQVNHTSESCADNLPWHRSSPEFLPEPAGQENHGTKQTMDQLDSGLPFFGIFPEAAQDHLEMPPLPPLPPMQWRMGKVHQAPLASLRESIQRSQDSYIPVLPSAADEKVQFGFPAPERGIMQPQNPILPMTYVDEKSEQHFERSDGNLVQHTQSSLQMPDMVNGLAGEGTQSMNPFLTLPTISSDRAKHGFHASGGEMIQSSSNPFSPAPALENTTSRHDLVSSQENLVQPLNQPPTEKAADVMIPQDISTDLEEQGDNSLNTFAPPQTIEDEPPQNGLPTSGGEIAWYSKTSAFLPVCEIPKPNGNSTLKIPRPRSPLIDAVAAHDKSTLRKVTERVRPQIEPKVDERDSLLEQIRTKSFNLKPAVVTRPSIQGPKTNLKVAAILEKANAIRQALAGSDDDDDDEDSWSDS